jgi:hypothetical protein
MSDAEPGPDLRIAWTRMNPVSQKLGCPRRVSVRPRVRQYRDDAQAPDETRYYQKVVIEVQYAFTDGRVSSTQAEVDDPVQRSLTFKDYARSLGADLGGISRVNPAFVLEESHIAHKYAISLDMEMDYGKINTTPKMPARVEVWRVYAALGEVSVLLAAHIRSLGYPAQAHHPARRSVAHSLCCAVEPRGTDATVI